MFGPTIGPFPGGNGGGQGGQWRGFNAAERTPPVGGGAGAAGAPSLDLDFTAEAERTLALDLLRATTATDPYAGPVPAPLRRWVDEPAGARRLAVLKSGGPAAGALQERGPFAGLVTYTRASTATYFGPDRKLRFAAVDEARIDHDPATGECLGYLNEGGRTNLARNALMFSVNPSPNDATAAWSSTLGLDGGTPAALIVPSTGNGSHTAYQSFLNGAASTTYCFSVYLKSAGMRYAMLELGNTAFGTNDMRAVFDLQNGTVAAEDTGARPDIQNCGGGWFRCSVVAATLASPGPNYIFAISPQTAGTLTQVFAGDGSAGVLAWAWQVEAHSSPTSWIPTAGAAVARSSDSFRVLGAPWFRSDECSLVVEADASGPPNANIFPGIGLRNANAQVQRIGLFMSGANSQLHVLLRDADNTGRANTASIGYWQPRVPFRAGVVAKAGAHLAATNGVVTAPALSNGGGVPTGIDRFAADQDTNWTGHIRRVRVWGRALSPAELAAETRPELELIPADGSVPHRAVSFSRSSSAMCVDRRKAAPPNRALSTDAPRFEWDTPAPIGPGNPFGAAPVGPDAAQPAGILLEEARTNIMAAGNSGISSGNAAGNAIAASTEVPALYANATVRKHTRAADKATFTDDNCGTFGAFSQATMTAGATYLVSLWVWVPSETVLQTNAGYIRTEGAAGYANLSSPPQSSVDPAKRDQWQRIGALVQAPATIIGNLLMVFRMGSATVGWLYTTAPQIELVGAGHTAPTSWVQTSSGVVTRAADQCKVDGAEFAKWLGGPSRTNLFAYASDFDNAAWAPAQVTVTPAAAVAPDGATTAEKLVPDATTNSHFIGQAIWVQAGQAYTYGCYAKAGEYSSLRLGLNGGTFGATNTALYCDLTAGTMVSWIVGTGAANTAYHIVPLPNGWCRVSITGTCTASGLHQFTIGTGSAFSFSTPGDGASGIFLWNAQCETGDRPSPAIPNATANPATVAGGAPQGCLVADVFMPANQNGSFRNIAALCAGGGAQNRLELRPNAAGNAFIVGSVLRNAGGTTAIAAGGAPPFGQWSRVAMRWGGGSYALCRDGLAPATQYGDVPAFDELRIGATNGGGGALNGRIKRVHWYRGFPTDAEMQAMTVS